MIVYLIKKSGAQYDITQACTSVTWSGSASSPCRQASFSYLNAPYDSSISLPTVATGDLISLVDDTEGEIFYGQIFEVERSSQIGTITYTAYDAMKNMLESVGQYNFKNVTPEAVAAQVCADVNMPVRFLHPTGVNIASMLCDNMNLHDIIMAAYTKAHAITGMKFFPMIYKRGFSVYFSNWYVDGFTLSEGSNIYESNIKETVSNLKNCIKVLDAKGNQIGEQRLEDSISTFGVFQDIYKQEKGVDPVLGSYYKLHATPKQTINLSAIGDVNCISCYFVKVHDSATGLDGKYWISSDSHTWENGNHKMNLELTFDSIMTSVKSSTEKRKTTKKRKSTEKGKK